GSVPSINPTTFLPSTNSRFSPVISSLPAYCSPSLKLIFFTSAGLSHTCGMVDPADFNPQRGAPIKKLARAGNGNWENVRNSTNPAPPRAFTASYLAELALKILFTLSASFEPANANTIFPFMSILSSSSAEPYPTYTNSPCHKISAPSITTRLSLNRNFSSPIATVASVAGENRSNSTG